MSTNINDYILSKIENYMLLEASVIDLATILGHTPKNPISSHIFCLELGLTIEEHDKIMGYLRLSSEKKDTFTLKEIHNEITNIVPKTAEMPKDIFKGMLKIFIKQFDIPLKISDQN